MKLPFDKVLFDPIRLQLVAYLDSEGSATFTDLKNYLETTDGNLGSHLRALEKNQIVNYTKDFVDRKTRTSYSLTQKGKNNLTNLKEWLFQNFFEGA